MTPRGNDDEPSERSVSVSQWFSITTYRRDVLTFVGWRMDRKSMEGGVDGWGWGRQQKANIEQKAASCALGLK